MKKILTAVLLLSLNLCLAAQDKETIDPDKKTDWWGDIDGFLDQQAKVSLGMADEALKMYPPVVEEPLIRKMALQMIDNVMHEERAPSFRSVQEFLNTRIENAIKEIREEKVDKGAVIWKLYNHTFIVKTASVTLGFDIQRGFRDHEEYVLSKELIKELVNLADILFISHRHDDHADKWVAQMFIEQNKPVVTPPDLWTGDQFYAKILHPERKPDVIQKINLPSKGKDLGVVVYPGHQGERILNNVYLVLTPEGLAFSHTGDQSNLADFDWIDRIGENHKVDVVMTNSWSVYPDQRLAHGYRPKLIIPGHENELGHTIDHREPYWLNYVRMPEAKKFPWVQMAWGEKYHYQ
jgi:L-ascorbate metabolism protein UlaG (beta-lactamase superfamily)